MTTTIDRRAAIVRSALRTFEAAGCEGVDPPILQPASVLFELYGEAIVERSFAIDDGSFRLRPDMTAAIAQAHLTAGAGSARYAAAGPVFRRPDPDGDRDAAVEQHQVGFEILSEPSDADRDAEAFLLTLRATAEAGVAVETVTGDLGIVFAVLDAVDMPERWRARLRRHMWRPARFQALLRRFGGADPADDRLAFLKAIGALSPADAEAAIRETIRLAETPEIGKRSLAEAAARLKAEAEDAQRHPLPEETVAVIEEAFAVRGSSDRALDSLRAVARPLDDATLTARLDRMARRLDALQRAQFDVSELAFDAGFGRNLEYYDGFVFEVGVRRGAAWVKLAGGGRYDGLMRALGAEGAAATGVGAALRVDALAEAAS